ncbi:MAG: DNA double-strand break repair nuclease NurA [Chthonomonadales bacterium]|nr:DNA double-strand break repair nuclease NurA [Chthonomonadales bacterium]
MLIPAQIARALEMASQGFTEHREAAAATAARYCQALESLGALSAAEIRDRARSLAVPGALPTDEHDATGGVVRFEPRFAHHEEARGWAAGVLRGVPVLAIDGSQIPAAAELSVPVAVAQVGWFLNPHDSGRPYDKGVRAVVLTPRDLRSDGLEGDYVASNVVALRRFELEAGQAAEAMEGQPSSGLVVLFDGSLVVTFAELYVKPLRARYLAAILRLLAASGRAGVPVVGYIDSSRARDLCKLVEGLFRAEGDAPVTDAGLLAGRLDWGDRTPVYRCARGGILADYVSAEHGDHRGGVCFVYLQLATGQPPARVEFPSWVYDAGLHERLLDVVRAEVVAGAGGYPYALETADAVAVITAEDRDRFYALFERFAERNRLGFRRSAKAGSKARRRA